jgi:hypothetical protein
VAQAERMTAYQAWEPEFKPQCCQKQNKTWLPIKW